MRSIKSFTLTILIGIVAVGVTISSARAALVEMDLNAAGDKLITLDDASGLEWLDVTATLGLSYNQALLTSFVTTQGFRHATGQEVLALYTAAGIIDISIDFVLGNFAGVLVLQDLLGCTTDCGLTRSTQQGLFDLGPEPATSAGLAFVQIRRTRGRARFGFIVPTTPFSETGEIGSYLLREAAISVVPLPAALPLYGTGLVMMGILGWRRKRQALRD